MAFLPEESTVRPLDHFNFPECFQRVNSIVSLAPDQVNVAKSSLSNVFDESEIFDVNAKGI